MNNNNNNNHNNEISSILSSLIHDKKYSNKTKNVNNKT